MRREKTERNPPVEESLLLRPLVPARVLKPSHIVRPEPKPAHRQSQSTPERLSHGLKSALAIPSPMDGKPLSPCSRRTRKEDGLLLAEPSLEQIEDERVVLLGVPVVDSVGVAAGVEDDVDVRDPLGEVGLEEELWPRSVEWTFSSETQGGDWTHLEGVDAHVEETLQLRDVPLARSRVGEVDDGQAGLPEVPLPNIAVLPLDEVPAFYPFFEQPALLGNEWIQPNADLDAVLLFDLGKVGSGVGEGVGVESEVAPARQTKTTESVLRRHQSD